MLNIIFNKLMEQLKLHEGIKLKPYKCTSGKLTIGIGRNLEDVGISEKEANEMLINDLLNWVLPAANKIHKDFDKFSANRQVAICDMIFNLGEARYRKFFNTIDAINQNDWQLAAIEAKDSAWYSQVGKRAEKIIEQFKNG